MNIFKHENFLIYSTNTYTFYQWYSDSYRMYIYIELTLKFEQQDHSNVPTLYQQHS